MNSLHRLVSLVTAVAGMLLLCNCTCPTSGSATTAACCAQPGSACCATPGAACCATPVAAKKQ